MARLLLTGVRPAAENMAIDEAMMETVRSTGKPSLRFYSWFPSAISVGYFQGLQEEVDVLACKDAGVDIVRRVTGGGAVFHHKEITYSLILPDTMVPKGINESYALLCGAMVEAFRSLGLEAQFMPINDIIVQGKKISGNAQTRKRGVVLQHGTILLDVDVDMMFTLLKVPQEKMKGKLIGEIKQRVTSLKTLGLEDVSKVQNALQDAFQKQLGIEFLPSQLTDTEKQSTKELIAAKYSTQEWIALR
jgi:lipoate---protein ligase